MEFSNKQSPNDAQEELKGTELLDQVVTLTGLEDNFVRTRLGDILDASGHRESVEKNDLTLDELRNSILKYLMELDAEMQASGACGESDQFGEVIDLASEPPLGTS